MQLHIRNKGEQQSPPQAPRGYAPLHSAKPMDEFDEELLEDFELEEVEEPSTWKTSRKIPILLFGGACIVLLTIVFIAKEFQADEPLQQVRVEGNRELLTSEVITLAAIDQKTKFYDLDLRAIEARVMKHGLARRVTASREMHPNAIVIHIEERSPLAMIRSNAGEPILIDNDFRFFLPKKLSGLLDPNKLLAVPVITGISERDTAAIIEMSKIIRTIETMGDSSLREALGELRRTPTGAYVIYTSSSQTPIFIGSPNDVRYTTTLERDASTSVAAGQETLFNHQLQLLASLWKTKLRTEIWSGAAMYVDARFSGQIVVHHKQYTARSAAIKHDSTIVKSSDTTKGLYQLTAITQRP